MSSCVLFKCHKKDEVTFEHLRKLQNESPHDVFAIFDCTHKDAMAGAWNFSIADYLESGYPLPDDEKLSYLPEMPPESKLIYFNPEYANLLFWKLTNTYDYYWIIEYDVFLNGNWKDFFEICDRSKADLIQTYRKQLIYPGQPFFTKFWETYNFDVPDEQKHGMFGPVARFSRKLFQVLDKEYLSGKHGFYEAIVPTLACMNGLTVCDINEIGEFFNYEFYHPYTFCGHENNVNWKIMVNSQSWNGYLFHPVREIFYKEIETGE
jgi:hypothetical protein